MGGCVAPYLLLVGRRGCVLFCLVAIRRRWWNLRVCWDPKQLFRLFVTGTRVASRQARKSAILIIQLRVCVRP